MNNRVKEVLTGILERFKSGDIPSAIAYATYPAVDVPSAKWSFLNRVIMYMFGTADARGFKQWHGANRYVKKGSRAFYILVPCFKKVEGETGEKVDALRYFKPAPVFRLEDTDGEPLDYQSLEAPDLPLIQRAEQWGISVKAIPGNYYFAGAYSKTRKEISLATPDECVFFHELAHASHEKIKGDLEGRQDPFQEIVAELSAQALCRLVGKQATDTIGNSFKYIEKYAGKLDMSPISACMRVMNETEKVINLILKGDDHGIHARTEPGALLHAAADRVGA